MNIKLDDINEIPNIINARYAKFLHAMHFVFAIKTDENKYFIFQEIQGMPIQRFVYNESNDSIDFVAAWSAWGNPESFVKDANGEEVKNWEDLLDRCRPHNAVLTPVGGFPSNSWESNNRQNKKEKNKKSKIKIDTFFEYRMDKIEKAVFKKESFELFSPTISFIGFASPHMFPYQIDGLDTYAVNVHQVGGARIHYNGKSFTINSNFASDEIPPGHPYVSHHVLDPNIVSYWLKNDEEMDEEYEQFDEKIANILLDDKGSADGILDVGQREIDLDFG